MTTATPAPLALPAEPDAWADWLRGYGEDQLAAAERTAATVRAARTDTQTSADVVAAWDEVGRRLGLVASAGELFAQVHPDAAVREVADDLSLRAAQRATEYGQDEAAYAVLSSLPTGGLDDDQRRFLALELRDFRRSGIDLDDEGRARLRDLAARETAAAQAFDNAIRDDVRSVRVTPDRLGGLPADWVAAHPVGDDGLVTITTDYPDLQPVLAFAADRELRAELRAQASRRAWPANEGNLRELVSLRNERARFLGHDGWADYDAQVKMIGSGSAIGEFVDRVAADVRPAGLADRDLLLDRLRADHPDATEVTVGDAAYYTEVLRRERHGVDAQEVRRYFSFEKVRAGLLDVTSRLFGLTMTPVDVPVWHESVTAYDVDIDREPLGRFYLDLHPREAKFGHAAQFSLVNGVAGTAVPEGVLVCNFPTGLMEHGQVVTLFHELGHLVHHLVGGRQRIARFSGVATEWDFVEAPSQMLEEWAWDADILASFATDEDGTAIPADLVARMREGKDFGRGNHVATQMYYAALSYWFYADPHDDIDAQREALRDRYFLLADLPDTHFHTSFGHLAGYSSGYYTYMWSLVIAKDLLSAFDPADLMDPAVARRYRDRVLAPGGSRDAADLVADFLGRPYSNEAFAAWLAS